VIAISAPPCYVVGILCNVIIDMYTSACVFVNAPYDALYSIGCIQYYFTFDFIYFIMVWTVRIMQIND